MTVRSVAGFLLVAIIAAAGVSTRGVEQAAAADLWQPVTDQLARAAGTQTYRGPYALARLNKPAFDAAAAAAAGTVITLPMPNGSFQRFTMTASPILGPALAAAFPEIRTFTGQGIDDPSAIVRFGWTQAGFHAIVLFGGETIYVDPYTASADLYVSAAKSSLTPPEDPFLCRLPGGTGDALAAGNSRGLAAAAITNGTSLRTYRLAIAATGEYTAAAGSVSNALARIVTTVNRVTAIYERELAIHFNLITGTEANPTALIYSDVAADPYTNTDVFAMLTQNQSTLDSVLGNGNYDLGHVFTIGGGAIVAATPSACQSSIKAQGVTQAPDPVGEAFHVDYAAHALGHQFGGNHTFNGTSGSCGGGARSAAHATEVGSGSTIMASAGFCGAENLQPHSNEHFTYESLVELSTYVTAGAGASCGTVTSTGNGAPTMIPRPAYTIPYGTPFTLTAFGSDPDGDTVTYDWEEHDLGTASSSVIEASTDNGTRPIFRSYFPKIDSLRTFPDPAYIRHNANVPPQTYPCAGSTCLTGEVLPSTNRTMTFTVTARDNRSGGGAITTASTTVTSTTAAGPFVVTAPNTPFAFYRGSQIDVTWNVAGSNTAPVSENNVFIWFSSDGGLTFTQSISATPNDGSATYTLPTTPTKQARIKVASANSVFFDISDVNFTISDVAFSDPRLPCCSTVIKAVDVAELRNYIDALRSRYGLGAVSWTDPTLTGGLTIVRAVHVTELRAALGEAYVAANRTPPGYSTNVTAGVLVKAVDILELRQALMDIW